MIACPVCLGSLVLVDDDGEPLREVEELFCPCGRLHMSALCRLPPSPGEELECPQWRFIWNVRGSTHRRELVEQDGRLWWRVWEAGCPGGIRDYEEIKAPRKRLRAVASLARDILAQEVLTS